jgi:hypothetical protein
MLSLKAEGNEAYRHEGTIKCRNDPRGYLPDDDGGMGVPDGVEAPGHAREGMDLLEAVAGLEDLEDNLDRGVVGKDCACRSHLGCELDVDRDLSCAWFSEQRGVLGKIEDSVPIKAVNKTVMRDREALGN